MYDWGNWWGYDWHPRHAQTYGLSVITPPTSEPVTLAEAKLHLRIDGDDEDALINSFITAARYQAEAVTNRALCTQTLEVYLDQFDFRRSIVLPHAPVQSVSWVKYYDVTGTQQTLSTSVYMLDSTRDPATIRLQYNQQWPTAQLQPQSVTIQYVAGYSADGSSVPDGIKSAMKLMIASWYENREDAEAPATNTRASEALLWPYRVWEA